MTWLKRSREENNSKLKDKAALSLYLKTLTTLESSTRYLVLDMYLWSYQQSIMKMTYKDSEKRESERTRKEEVSVK